MKVVICALAKNENLYINDWVKYYINLGFDQIFLYDNNDSNSPFVGDFIDKEYKDKVIIININDKKEKGLQWHCYSEFYNKYKFDWCLFCDIDEYLIGVDNIKSFLNNPIFNNIEQIRIKWNLYGDDNIIERDISQPIHGFFKHIIKDNQLSNQGKCLLRGNLKDIIIKSCHYAFRLDKNNNRIDLKSCLPSGTTSKGDNYNINSDYSKEKIFINHYMTKTLAEFINQKLGRGDAVFKDRSIDLEYFWNINEKTPEKIKWLRERGLIE